MSQYNGSSNFHPEEDLDHLRMTAKHEATALSDVLKGEALAFIRDKQATAAEGLAQTASSLRDNPNRENPALNAMAAPIADAIEQSAERIRAIEPEAAARKARKVASDNPAAVVLGAAAIGFFAARFLTASSQDHTTPTDHDINKEELSYD